MHTISIYIYGGHVEDIKRAIRRSDSCISDGEEQRVRIRGKILVPIPSQAHDAKPDHKEVQLAPHDAESKGRLLLSTNLESRTGRQPSPFAGLTCQNRKLYGRVAVN